jgi:hypothetical protein
MDEISCGTFKEYCLRFVNCAVNINDNKNTL